MKHLPEDWEFMPWRSKWVWLMENYGEFDECAEDEPYTYDIDKMPDDVKEEYLRLEAIKKENLSKGILID